MIRTNQTAIDAEGVEKWAAGHSDAEVAAYILSTRMGRMARLAKKLLPRLGSVGKNAPLDADLRHLDQELCMQAVALCGDDNERVERIMLASKLRRNEWDTLVEGEPYISKLVRRTIKQATEVFRREPISKLLYCLTELRNLPLEVPPPIVEGLLSEGETILVVGRPKVGKSRLVAQLAICVARGEAFLGRNVLRCRKVLMLDLENRPAIIKERFGRMAQSHHGDSNIFIVAPESLSENTVKLDQEGMQRLMDLLDETGAEVLVIDTWRLFLCDGDENKAEVVTAGLRQLSELRVGRRRLAIILVHHLRKQSANSQLSLREDPYSWIESVSGHHALVGHVDACFGLEREFSAGEPTVVFGGVARNAVSASMILEDDGESLLFAPASGVDALLQILTPAESKLFTVAEKLKQFGFEQLIREAGTRNRKAVASMLHKALGQRVFTKDNHMYSIVAG